MSDKILKLSQAQTLYQDLRERIDALPTDSDIPSVPVQDVQINGISILNNGVANIPNSGYGTYGVVKLHTNVGNDGLKFDSSGNLAIYAAFGSDMKQGRQIGRPITPSTQHESTFYGLAKAAGADMKDIASTTIGTYPDEQQAAIQNMLGVTPLFAAEEQSTATAAHVVNSLFMMNGKLHRATVAIAIGDAVEVGTNCEVVKADEVFVKTTDIATRNTFGLVSPDISMGTDITNGKLIVYPASIANIKAGTDTYRPITPSTQNSSIYYGLSKLAGIDLKNETVTVGTYPETSKTAIRALIGAAAANDVTVTDVQVNGSSILNSNIANIPIATTTTLGVIKIGDRLAINPDGTLYVYRAASDTIKAGTSNAYVLTPNGQHESVFYGLAKAAGDSTQAASENAVGTYTDDAKAAIQTMLNVPGDVQVNGTSVVSSGVANVPVATGTVYGVVKAASGNGVFSELGTLYIYGAQPADIKTGAHPYKPIVPIHQHEAVFYGLAKAAGDTTMSSSSNAVGTYTTEAKSAIHTMLGIDPASIAAQVDIPLVETVSGTTPTITGQPNVRYVCGEVSTITITPPASGSVDIIFESGSTPTTLTVPNTVKWPAWFDATALEAETTYEILITDSKYGAVMTWAT